MSELSMGEAVVMPGVNDEQTKAESVILPGASEGVKEDLISPSIDEALAKKRIDTVIVKETNEIKVPSYLVDISNLASMMPCAMTALKALVNSGNRDDTSEDSEVEVYCKTRTGIFDIGTGNRYEMHALLNKYTSVAFGEECKVYRNLDGKFRKLKARDVSGIRLDI